MSAEVGGRDYGLDVKVYKESEHEPGGTSVQEIKWTNRNRALKENKFHD